MCAGRALGSFAPWPIMKLPAGDADHPDGRSGNPGNRDRRRPSAASDRRHDHGKVPPRRCRRGSDGGTIGCRAASLSGGFGFSHRRRRRRRRAAWCAWRAGRRSRACCVAAAPPAVPADQFLAPPLRRRGQIRIRVEPKEGVDVLDAAARSQPLPQRGLRHLRRRLGGIHDLDVERALGPAASAVLDQVLERARGAAEAGLRHIDQGRQLLRLEPIAGPHRGDAKAHQAARQALDGHRQPIAVRVGGRRDAERTGIDPQAAMRPRPRAAGWRR